MFVRRFLIFLVLFCLFYSSNSIFAQRKSRSEGHSENHSPFGRRKKERRNQRFFSKRAGLGFFSFLRGKRSRGNSERFANNRIIGKRGFFASLFGSRHGGNASLRRTKTARREDRNLFRRHHTKSKISFRKRQDRQGRRRERTRKRGNVLFSKRKR